jgi:hypothetical protein
VISRKSWKSLVIILLPLGKSLPSNQQPRFILLLSTLLLSKRVSLPSSWTKEKILEIQRAAKEVCSRGESFEEKLQFLFTTLFDPMVSALRNDDNEEDGGSLDLSVVLEEQSQFLIQNHLYLSIVENLFSSSSSTSSLDQDNHNLPAFWLQIPLDISKSFRRIVKATSPVRIDLAGGWVSPLQQMIQQLFFSLLTSLDSSRVILLPSATTKVDRSVTISHSSFSLLSFLFLFRRC